jgi:hypothetical protein
VLVSATTAFSALVPVGPTLASRRDRRAQRRRLRRQDLLSARLAELAAISGLMEEAVEVVERGWVQGGWFSVTTPDGGRVLTAYDVGLAESNPVSGACLVGGVVHAGGGPAAVRSQLVQRSLDLVWHVLREDPARPVRWCPGPPVRLVHLLDLTTWNDAPGRTRGEVVGLLLASGRAADRQRELCLARQAEPASAF